MQPTVINEALARRVLEIVDAGLIRGMGVQVPGSMCVEAAVCLALGLPHGDDPPCVGYSLRAYKIRLNDSDWSTPAARAKGMRRLAIAQLGSNLIDQRAFAIEVTVQVTRQIFPIALRSLATLTPDFKDPLETAALACEIASDLKSVSAASASARSLVLRIRDKYWKAADAAAAAYAAAYTAYTADAAAAAYTAAAAAYTADADAADAAAAYAAAYAADAAAAYAYAAAAAYAAASAAYASYADDAAAAASAAYAAASAASADAAYYSAAYADADAAAAYAAAAAAYASDAATYAAYADDAHYSAAYADDAAAAAYASRGTRNIISDRSIILKESFLALDAMLKIRDR